MNKNIRLQNYDYKTNGYYFVTICADYRKKMFNPRISAKYGHSVPASVVARPWRAESEAPDAALKSNTDIVEEKIFMIEKKFSVKVDFYCIMPDHIHMIIALHARQGRATTELALHARQGRATTELGWVINAFKGWCTRTFGRRIFQPNYYEHIIRNEKALSKIRRYIRDNPEREKYNWDDLENI